MTYPRRRRTRRRQEKRLVLIACEGKETEPNYFDGLQREETVRANFAVTILRGRGKSPLGTVQTALDRMKKARQRGKEFQFDEVWCVLDVEEAGKNPRLDDARKLAGEHGVRLVLSNPTFEVWALAHFKRTSAAFLDGSKVIAELNKHWQGAFSRKYEKNDDEIYRRLMDRTAEALENARLVREKDWKGVHDLVKCNSATEVDQVVWTLLGKA